MEIVLLPLCMVAPYLVAGACLFAAVLSLRHTLSGRFESPYYHTAIFWALLCSFMSVVSFVCFIMGAVLLVQEHIYFYGKEDAGMRVTVPALVWVLPLLACSFASWFGGLPPVVLLLRRRSRLRRSSLAIMSYILEISATGLTFYWLYDFLIVACRN